AELRRLGFIEAQNLAVDERGYGLRVDQMDEHAAEVVKSGIDVIMVGGDAAGLAAQRALGQLPVLALTAAVAVPGFVPSLAKPGGNTTGAPLLASELDGKRQEILLEALPGARRMSALFFNNRNIILDRAAALRLPAMYQWPEWAEEGGLIGYGPRILQLYRDIMSRQLAALLRGTKPADLPVEQPTRFELV